MFVRADADGSQTGLGVGLAIATRSAETHGGTIEAHSAGRGRGAEFVVRLPLLRASDRPSRTASAVSRSAGRRLKVLVVDDNHDLVEMMELAIDGMGHEVRKATDGETAISVALAFRPDVVLLDIGLPIVSGLEVARRLRQRPELSHVRLIAMTGWGQAADRRQTAEVGFDHHLTKPVDPAELETLLAMLPAQATVAH
jgi:CheY-like chemotaxis protein